MSREDPGTTGPTGERAMKLRFKRQQFQADAAEAVCGVFAGQPYSAPASLADKGAAAGGQGAPTGKPGFGNNRLVPELTDDAILERIRGIQRHNRIEPSRRLEGRYNLTVEMETGVGKTYTYIKTMYELNRRYGWRKFVVVVPSVAVREGVYKSFQMTEEHFAEEYGAKIRYFIYSSSRLAEIDRFASDGTVNAMIINSQAFNARGVEARRIAMKLDGFRSRRPIDILAGTNPILVIDEPQAVEGAATRERLREFSPLMTLRYSATPRPGGVYNLVYRLDAMDAYNRRLVKRIAVKGISPTGSAGTGGYVYLEGVNLSRGNPAAVIEFDAKRGDRVRKIIRTVEEGFDLFPNSGGLDGYRTGYAVLRIDGRDGSVEFANGVKLFSGDVVGLAAEGQLRRIQIRETILSHLERERRLFPKGIKVLSLFFIDEVVKYRRYDGAGVPGNGEYADMFEEEYAAAVGNMRRETGDGAYMAYVGGIAAGDTHAGYFSVDRKSRRLIDGRLGDRRERTSDDSDAYDLIMKDKERLLDRREPVRFIFSHSALREGWDNPNVFQICTLKHSGSDVRKRQEVGRGLRLSVDQNGERMDANLLGGEVHAVNVLTVIAGESYDRFARGLQSEIAEAVGRRPRLVTADLFAGRVVHDAAGAERVVDADLARAMCEGLVTAGYVEKGTITDRYYEDARNGAARMTREAAEFGEDVFAILDSVHDSRSMVLENARESNVELKLDDSKLDSGEFKALWSRIGAKSAYRVEFDEEELIGDAVRALNRELDVPGIRFRVEAGELEDIQSREQLRNGEAFVPAPGGRRDAGLAAGPAATYDLAGRIVAGTGLTRRAAIRILCGLEKAVFNQFGNNPEEFIIRAAAVINGRKAAASVGHIAYYKLDSAHDAAIFAEPSLKGRLGVNAMKAHKHIYDHVLYDSAREKAFAEQLDAGEEVALYAKLPGGFCINTPAGAYHPDWAIAFRGDRVKRPYFVAETKSAMAPARRRGVEEAKIHCAREHFRAIGAGSVAFAVVDSYAALRDRAMR